MSQKVQPLASVLPDCWSSEISEGDLASKYDYCMVLHQGDHDGLDEYGKFAITTLNALGLEYFIFRETETATQKEKKHKGDGKMFVLIRAPVEVLRLFCDKVDMLLLLDPDQVEKACLQGDKAKGIAGFTIRHEPNESFLRPYDLIHGTYKYHNKGIDESLYWRPPGHSHPFREIIRLKLTEMLIEERPQHSEVSIRIYKDIEDKKIVTFFPLQNKYIAEKLSAEMLVWNRFPWHENIEPLKEYFGEKIGLFFKFMAHQNTWIMFPAFLGLGAQGLVWGTGNYSHPILPVYSAIILIWGILMQEYWKRTEKYTAHRWGQIGFEKAEGDRAEFKGKEMQSYLNGQNHLYFPSKRTRVRIMTHGCLILVVVFGVLAAVGAIYVAKYLKILDQTSASLINAGQIQLFNVLYGYLADFLTEFENHRTETLFENYLIGKLFLFQFVNSYASFFYLAFIANFTGECFGTLCMETLAVNMGIVFGTRIVVANVTGVLIPYLQYRMNIRSKGLTLKTLHTIPRPEQEELRADYNPIKDDIRDNAEVVIQFGYMMLFVVALPIGAFASAIFNIIKFKMSAYKLLHVYERATPTGCEDIGTWQTIYFLVNVSAVVCNSALVVFTMVVLDGYSPYEKMWTFIGIILACYLIMYGMMEAVPDVPREVEIQMERQEHIISKVIEKVADDKEEELHEMPNVPIVISTYPMKS